MSTETKPESTQMPLGPGGRRPSTCSVHIGPGQVKAAAIWEDFKGDELRFVDVLELCSCLMVNVADKSQSTDNEISTMVRRLMHDMRRNAARQNAEPIHGEKDA